MMGVWWVCMPDGKKVSLDDRWRVEEHDDGTISVFPSINMANGWRGYLRNGEFEPYDGLKG